MAHIEKLGTEDSLGISLSRPPHKSTLVLSPSQRTPCLGERGGDDGGYRIPTRMVQVLIYPQYLLLRELHRMFSGVNHAVKSPVRIPWIQIRRGEMGYLRMVEDEIRENEHIESRGRVPSGHAEKILHWMTPNISLFLFGRPIEEVC